MLLVSRWKLKKMVLEYGIVDVIGFNRISDDKLDNMFGDHRNMSVLACGRSITLGYLNLTGIKVQQISMENVVRIDLIVYHIQWS